MAGSESAGTPWMSTVGCDDCCHEVMGLLAAGVPLSLLVDLGLAGDVGTWAALGEAPVSLVIPEAAPVVLRVTA
jgi:hypothetical protein